MSYGSWTRCYFSLYSSWYYRICGDFVLSRAKQPIPQILDHLFTILLNNVSPYIACGMGWSYWLNWIIYIPSECIAGGIIMHTFLPAVPTYMWDTLFGLFITIINLIKVKFFGKIEFWMVLVKIIAFGLFSIVAILIFFDIIQNNTGSALEGTYIAGEGSFFLKANLC